MIKNRNNNGRPKKSSSDKKSFKLEVRLRMGEYYGVKGKARMADMIVSEFIRRALQNSTVKERLNSKHLHHISQLTGMANNLNQIAKRANAAGYSNVKLEVDRLVENVKSLIKLIEYDS